MINTNGKPQLDKYLMPVGSVASKGTYQKQVPWKFGVQQGIQAKKIRASSGQFHNITGTISGTQIFTGGTVTNSLVETGTVANNLIEGGTVETCLFTAGTAETILMHGGTVGTALIQGGTVNPSVYQDGNGSVGLSTVLSYIKSGTVVGTLTFSNGLLINSV